VGRVLVIRGRGLFGAAHAVFAAVRLARRDRKRARSGRAAANPARVVHLSGTATLRFRGRGPPGLGPRADRSGALSSFAQQRRLRLFIGPVRLRECYG